MALLLSMPQPAWADRPTPTPTATAIPPAAEYLGFEYFDLFRIENAFDCGGSAHDCMWSEPDDLVLTRIAMGEAPNSINDRIYIMWTIVLRAELGFKNSRHEGHIWDDRWGERTSIKEEALCNSGCQFSPARAAQDIYFPCRLPEGSNMRIMLCPTDDQIPAFLATYIAARRLKTAPLSDFPMELRGYDGFRSPSVSWNGTIDWLGGQPSRQMFPRGNVWRDEYPEDNAFWQAFDQAPPKIPTGTSTAAPATKTPMPENGLVADLMLHGGKPHAMLLPEPDEQTIQKEDTVMFELSPEMLLVVGLVASILTQILKFIFEKAGWSPPGEVKMVILFVIAVGLAFGFFYASFMADPIGSIAGIMGVAVVIYELLMKKVIFPVVRLA